MASQRDIVVIGASAGGVEALIKFVGLLPKEFNGSIFIVLHITPDATSILPEILTRNGPLPASHPKDEEAILPGHIYVAPPNHHMLLEPGQIRLTRGPRENRSRPAIDPLFRSAAKAYGNSVIGVILTGTLNDGTAGMVALRSGGGIGIAQDPEEALYPEMPRNVIERAGVDHVLRLAEIPPMIEALRREPIRVHHTNYEELTMHEKLLRHDIDSQENNNRDGMTSVYTCPDCGGILWEVDEADQVHFRCHLGHAMTAESLLQGVSEEIEDALWSAVRSLTEKAILSRQLATRFRDRGSEYSAQGFEDQAVEVEQHITLLRRLLLGPSDEPVVSP